MMVSFRFLHTLRDEFEKDNGRRIARARAEFHHARVSPRPRLVARADHIDEFRRSARVDEHCEELTSTRQCFFLADRNTALNDGTYGMCLCCSGSHVFMEHDIHRKRAQELTADA